MRGKNLGLIVTLVVGLLTTPLRAEAQQEGKVYRIGYLSPRSPETYKNHMAAFRQGLRELGYSEGENIVIEARYAEGKRDRPPALAEELVRLNLDVIVGHGGPLTRLLDQTAKQAGKTIPQQNRRKNQR
jgi:putative ABC transport system substrate-binding protein